MLAYSRIKNELDSLSRQEAYRKLLATTEWFSFRERIMDLDNKKCVKCKRPEGIIEIPIPKDEYRQKVEDVRIHNLEFQKKIKEPNYLERFIKIWMGELDEELDSLWAEPCDHEFGGRVVLQVHHKLYFYDKLPWEYEREYVETLCSECHAEIHATTVIMTYKNKLMTLFYKNIPCSKCGGTGFLEEYDYYLDGICFKCGGIGSITNDEINWIMK